MNVPLADLGGKGATLSTVALLGCWQPVSGEEARSANSISVGCGYSDIIKKHAPERQQKFTHSIQLRLQVCMSALTAPGHKVRFLYWMHDGFSGQWASGQYSSCQGFASLIALPLTEFLMVGSPHPQVLKISIKILKYIFFCRSQSHHNIGVALSLGSFCLGSSADNLSLLESILFW